MPSRLRIWSIDASRKRLTDMAYLVSGTDISTAWLESAVFLAEEPHWRTSNLIVVTTDALTERPAVRRQLDQFYSNVAKENTPEIETVAGTIFLESFYQPHAPDPQQHLYDLERKIRPIVRRHPQNRRGTYFERLVAWPDVNGEDYNQIKAVIRNLQAAQSAGQRNGNRFELALYHPVKDPYPFGFPCLSHISLTLREGKLDMSALYRNQYFITRAYGNYLGLARLLRFLAVESGFDTGELVCIAANAQLDTDRATKTQVRELLAACEAADKTTEAI